VFRDVLDHRSPAAGPDLSRAVTGEIHYVDGGYNIVAMPRLDALKSEEKSARDAAE